MCSFCCVASVVKSLVSVSFSLAFFSTKYRSSKILFHTLLTFMHMSCSSRTKHHKHKLYQHLYSYILQNKWHYKTCLALAADNALQTQTVKASGTTVLAKHTNDMHNYNANIETVQTPSGLRQVWQCVIPHVFKSTVTRCQL